ncbi:MAG: hypothetical protein ACRD1B_03670 [Thermoanaerobaculia bacterium]
MDLFSLALAILGLVLTIGIAIHQARRAALAERQLNDLLSIA